MNRRAIANKRQLRLEPAGRRSGGRARGRFTDEAKEDVELVGVRDAEADEEGWRVRWRKMISCAKTRMEQIFDL